MNHLMDRKLWFFILSTLIIIPGLISLVMFGLKLGIDFTGGTIVEYKFVKSVLPEDLKQTVEGNGVEVLSLRQDNPNQYTLKTKPLEDKKITELKDSLNQKFEGVEQQRLESVGPVIGGETTKNAFLALLVASFLIVVYIAWAFRKVPKPASSIRFGVAAIVALIHDVVVVIGAFSLLGHFFGAEADVLFVTALLTIIGFSVHDTIVVFDRIRENLPKHLSMNFTQVANLAITQTLARSLNTSLTVVFVLLALLLFGGESIRWFVVALLIGVVSGTYSSIFNATAALCLWEEKLGH